MRGISFHHLILVTVISRPSHPPEGRRGAVDAHLEASSWLPRTAVRWWLAMDGENILMLKAGNLRCYYVQTPEERTALSNLSVATLRGMRSL